MKIFAVRWLLVCWVLGIGATGAHAQSTPDDYSRMLSYLSSESRIEGTALAGATGAIAINQAAGDFNLQANMHSFASGQHAKADVRAAQVQQNNLSNAPMHASAIISGAALAGVSGIASINQASGSANTELNTVAASLAAQGIREATDEAMSSSSAFASAGEQYVVNDPRTTREVGVESTALRGFEGVLQLNQIAGSGNATENVLSISVQGSP